MQNDTEKEVFQRQYANMMALIQSEGFGRFAQLQPKLAGLDEPEQLIEFFSLINLAGESALSAITELHYLVLAEIVFIRLNQSREPTPASIIPYLEEVRYYAEIRQEVSDLGFFVEYFLLASTYAFLNNKDEDALRYLYDFETVIKPFQKPEDEEYIAKMSVYIKNQEYEQARGFFRQRMSNLFMQHFREIVYGLSRKLSILKHILGIPIDPPENP